LISAQKSSNAYELQEDEYYIPEHKSPQKVRKSFKQQSQVKGTDKIKTILGILICFAVAFCILLRYVTITEASNKIDGYKKQISQLERLNEQMQVEIDRSIDLKKVEEIARTKLGMRRPEKFQMVYVKLDKSDYAEIVEQPMDNTNKNRFAAVVTVINNVLEYLN
jgi:cell division protein FtsL